jgi:hypothetical protein
MSLSIFSAEPGRNVGKVVKIGVLCLASELKDPEWKAGSETWRDARVCRSTRCSNLITPDGSTSLNEFQGVVCVCVLVPASHVDFESKNEKKFRDLGQVWLQIGKDVFFREEVNRSVSGFVVCCLVRKPAKINTKHPAMLRIPATAL